MVEKPAYDFLRKVEATPVNERFVGELIECPRVGQFEDEKNFVSWVIRRRRRRRNVCLVSPASQNG
jgi:hypothetical protein